MLQESSRTKKAEFRGCFWLGLALANLHLPGVLIAAHLGVSSFRDTQHGGIPFWVPYKNREVGKPGNQGCLKDPCKLTWNPKMGPISQKEHPPRLVGFHGFQEYTSKQCRFVSQRNRLKIPHNDKKTASQNRHSRFKN